MGKVRFVMCVFKGKVVALRTIYYAVCPFRPFQSMASGLRCPSLYPEYSPLQQS